MRIALIASSRHPIREPFAGGLEAQTAYLAEGLRERGHAVTLFAADGSMQSDFRVSEAASNDPSMAPTRFLADHHAYLSLMMHLSERGNEYDVVHNNSLHYLPIAMARLLSVPMVTTLHTPPTPWLESAIASGPCPVSFVAVSHFTARSWAHVVAVDRIVLNGVDVDRWRPGPGDGPAVWFGRVVPEKGPDVAIRAARSAGIPLLLAGPISDEEYFTRRVRPLLGSEAHYVGHLRHDELNELVGRAVCSVVTPRWDEPYGLVAAESLACATPVVGLRRGGLAEVVDEQCARLVDTHAALARQLRDVRLDRSAARRRAEQACSISRMIDQYEAVYAAAADRRSAA